MSNKIKVKVENLNLYYGENHALKDVNMDIQENAVTAFIGPSGCGKSTFLKTLNRMIEEEGGFYKGKIILDGEDIKGLSTEVLRTRIGMVFQQPIAFPYSIEKNLSYVLKYHGIREAGEIERITRECLQKARLYDEIKDQLKKSAKKLSGGQKQRAAVARALITDPKLILADEPTGALDSKAASALLSMFGEINDEGQTILMVTHDAFSASYARKVFMLKDGEIFTTLHADAERSVFYERILQLLASMGGD